MYTELWDIVGFIANENPQFSFSELVESTKQVISHLITQHHLTLISETTEKPLVIPEEEIISIVVKNLMGLNSQPDIGDGIWMAVNSGNSV